MNSCCRKRFSRGFNQNDYIWKGRWLFAEYLHLAFVKAQLLLKKQRGVSYKDFTRKDWKND